MSNINKIVPNNYIIKNNELYQVVDVSHNKTARRGAVVKLKIKNLKTQNTSLHTTLANDDIKVVNIDKVQMEYLYSRDDGFIFWDEEQSEEVLCPREVCSEQTIKFLNEGIMCNALIYEQKIVSISIPTVILVKIESTVDSAVKGNSVSTPLKKAVLDNGHHCDVPLFIKTGDTIEFNTETNSYIKRIQK